jgi:SAM-dependent methyltransferase
VNHDDHVALLRDGMPAQPGGVWADLGAGGGAFTLALADLLGASGELFAVDRDARGLRALERELRNRFPDTRLQTLVADFTRPLGLPPLDGLVLANSLHFVADRDKGPTLGLLRAALKPGGRLLIVEYNAERGNRWVPHPLTLHRWAALAREHGFAETRLLARRPSRFLGEIFSAVSLRPAITDVDEWEHR